MEGSNRRELESAIEHNAQLLANLANKTKDASLREALEMAVNAIGIYSEEIVSPIENTKILNNLQSQLMNCSNVNVLMHKVEQAISQIPDILNKVIESCSGIDKQLNAQVKTRKITPRMVTGCGEDFDKMLKEINTRLTGDSVRVYVEEYLKLSDSCSAKMAKLKERIELTDSKEELAMARDALKRMESRRTALDAVRENLFLTIMNIFNQRMKAINLTSEFLEQNFPKFGIYTPEGNMLVARAKEAVEHCATMFTSPIKKGKRK